MKLIYTFFLFIYISIQFACNSQKNLVTISGKITNPNGELHFIFSDTTISTPINNSGRFRVSFYRDSSDYAKLSHGSEMTSMYIKPSDNIFLSLETTNFDESISYRNSEESSFLAYKYLLIEEKDFYGESLYLKNKNDYEEYLLSFKNELIKYLDRIQNLDFVTKEKSSLDISIKRYRSQKEKLSDFTLDESKYTWEKRLIAGEFNLYNAINKQISGDFNSTLVNYKNKILNKLNFILDSNFINQEKQILKKEISRWKKMKISYDSMPLEGDQAIDFSYPDKDGEYIKLTSFKGNLVYVDVWATWCGPCISEIPSLKSLQQKYKDEKIVFLSVSVDTDKDAWGKMVENDQLLGVHLWANGWNKITNDYAIFGIPRFMLFDENSNVISTDAPRPSSNTINELIDKHL